jgi:hypothetical protein
LEKVPCGHCGAMIGRQALKMHQSRKVCELKRKEWALSEENPANRDDPDNLEEDGSEPMREPMTGHRHLRSIVCQSTSHARWIFQY